MKVSIISGSKSDHEMVNACCDVLVSLGIKHENIVLSAHRDPEKLKEYIKTLDERGFKIIIAMAGLSAHLPGVVASQTQLPVLGVPLNAGSLGGVDALLSISQMPSGVPVGCLGIGKHGARNAAHLASRIINLFK